MNKHNVIQKTQYGFQKNVSTNHAIIHVVTNCLENINSKPYTGLVFLDLTKAFDTVSHEILIHKLDHYGIRGQTIKLMQDFLNRNQYVLVNGIKSNLLINKKWRQGYQTHLYIFGDHTFIGDRAQGYSQW